VSIRNPNLNISQAGHRTNGKKKTQWGINSASAVLRKEGKRLNLDFKEGHFGRKIKRSSIKLSSRRGGPKAGKQETKNRIKKNSRTELTGRGIREKQEEANTATTTGILNGTQISY